MGQLAGNAEQLANPGSTRWVPCPNCSGELLASTGWQKDSVVCPNCEANIGLASGGTPASPGPSHTSNASDVSPEKPAVPRASQPTLPENSAPDSVTPCPPQSPVVAQGPATATNGYAVTGLTLGIVSVFLYAVGVLPILAIVFSSIGLAKAGERLGKGRVQASFGLALGILYTLMSLFYRPH